MSLNQIREDLNDLITRIDAFNIEPKIGDTDRLVKGSTVRAYLNDAKASLLHAEVRLHVLRRHLAE